MIDKEYIIKRLKEIYYEQHRIFTEEDEKKTLELIDLIEKIRNEELPIEYVDNLVTGIKVRGSIFQIDEKEREAEYKIKEDKEYGIYT